MRPVDVTSLLMLKLIACASIVLAACTGCGAKPKTHVNVPAVVEKESTPDPTAPAYVLFHADTSFTPSERESLALAAEMWRIQTDGLADIHLLFQVNCNDDQSLELHKEANLLCRFESTEDYIVEHDAQGQGDLLGQVAPSGGIHNPWRKPLRMLLVVDRLDTRDRFASVAIHEFGHVLGLPHTSAVQAVMFPMYIKHEHSCLKQPDLQAFCQVNDCGTHKMHPCE